MIGILTDYYFMSEIVQRKSHRLDCLQSTGHYPLFEAIAQRSKNGKFYLYCSKVPKSFKADAHRQADRIISNSDNISSIFVPNLEKPLLGYGDVRGTNDALLFRFSNDDKQLEIFVARGYKHNAMNLYNLFAEGELDEDIKALIMRAKQ